MISPVSYLLICGPRLNYYTQTTTHSKAKERDLEWYNARVARIMKMSVRYRDKIKASQAPLPCVMPCILCAIILYLLKYPQSKDPAVWETHIQ